MNTVEAPKKDSFLSSLPFLLVGFGLFAFAFYTYRQQSAFYGAAAFTEGVVVGQVPYRSSSYRGWKPVIRFSAAGGEHQIEGPVQKSEYKNGERFRVAYSPANPAEAKVDSFMQRWALIGGLSLLGLGFSAVGLGRKKS